MRCAFAPVLCALAAVLILAGCGGKSYHESLQMQHFNYGEVLDGHMMRAERAMLQVRDIESARAAAAKIALINQDIADVVYNAPRLSPEGQIELGKIAAEHLTEVQRLKGEIDRSPPLAEVFGKDLEDMVGYLTVMVSGKYEDSPLG
jgi:hypothetical protein